MLTRLAVPQAARSLLTVLSFAEVFHHSSVTHRNYPVIVFFCYPKTETEAEVFPGTHPSLHSGAHVCRCTGAHGGRQRREVDSTDLCPLCHLPGSLHEHNQAIAMCATSTVTICVHQASRIRHPCSLHIMHLSLCYRT